eukprot:PhM_4_TR5800/c1_g1_i1/m.30678/K07937/ARF1; ADP-ribosylation factor 1
MGSALSFMAKMIFQRKNVRIIMVGLDAAGKTTILYKMKLNEVVTTIPTIGFNVETVEYKNLKLTMWDVGGQDKLRGLWHHYYANCDAVIYVVDSADTTRLEKAAEELHKLLESDELAGAPVLVYANKQDVRGAASAADIVQKLGLNRLSKSREWHVQPAVATSGEGLFEGLDRLSSMLK